MKDPDIEKLDAVWPEPRKCSVCGATDGFGIGAICSASKFTRFGFGLAQPELLIVPVQCGKCQAIQFFNASALDVFKEEIFLGE